MTVRSFEDKHPQLAASAYVDEDAVVIGDVTLEADVSIWPGAVLRGDVHSIRVGVRSNIQDNSVLHVTHDGPDNPGGFPLTVGTGVTVGHRVILHGCRIGDYCLIGMGATVMDGARLEPRVILAAGSLVPSGKVLAGGHLWVGAPARKVRPLSEQELASLAYAADHYARLKDRYRAA